MDEAMRLKVLSRIAEMRGVRAGIIDETQRRFNAELAARLAPLDAVIAELEALTDENSTGLPRS